MPNSIALDDSLTAPTRKESEATFAAYPTSKESDVFDAIDPKVEKRVLRKIDKAILILFFLIYGMQYLDKGGIECLWRLHGAWADGKWR